MPTTTIDKYTAPSISREEIEAIVKKYKEDNKELVQALEAMERNQRLQSERVKHFMPKVSYSAM